MGENELQPTGVGQQATERGQRKGGELDRDSRIKARTA